MIKHLKMRFFIIHSKFILIFISVSLVITLSSCFHKKKDNKELWIGRELLLPEITSKDKKIVTRFEGDCPSCIASIIAWKKIYGTIRERKNNIKFVFYVEIIQEEAFKELQRKLDFADYVIFDQKGSFFKYNLLQFPYGLEDQTFLLDENNKIILFGNPTVKPDLLTKYIERI
jgi:hypothetical protein